jgi:subtilisin family serine protease
MAMTAAACSGGGTKASPPPTEAKPSAPVAPTDWDALNQAVAQRGTIPVVVALDTSFVPEGYLSAKDQARQRAQIQKIGQQLEARFHGITLPAGIQLQGSESVPFVTLNADAQILDILRQLPFVKSVAEDHPAPLPPPESEGEAPAPPLASGPIEQLPANQNWPAWDVKRVNAPAAWAAGFDGRGQTIAIIDTGVQADHPYLGGKVVEEACYSLGNACPNGAPEQVGRGAAAPCAATECRHGTHVAGIAAGKYGVAPGANLIAIQVFSPSEEHPGHVTAYEGDQVLALRHVYELRNRYRIAAVNISIGGASDVNDGFCDDRADRASFWAWAATLRSVGIATVIASGNDGFSHSIDSPSCNSSAISVGNTTVDDQGNDAIARGSNSSAVLSLLAPGTQVPSSVLGGKYGYLSGTSMAAPHVAGAIAVLRQAHAGPVDAEVKALQSTGRPVVDPRNVLTFKDIDVAAALKVPARVK